MDEETVMENEVKEKETKRFPSAEELREELKHEKSRSRNRRIVRRTLLCVLLALGLAVIAAAALMPVYQMTGSSMSNTLSDSDIIVVMKKSTFRRGEVVAFENNGNLMIKRIIAMGGDTIDIDPSGNVTLNGSRLAEEYVSKRELGICDIKLPYTVPEGKLFVMGDNRKQSVDSRHSSIGCISPENVIGRVVLKVWPLNRLSWVGRD